MPLAEAVGQRSFRSCNVPRCQFTTLRLTGNARKIYVPFLVSLTGYRGAISISSGTECCTKERLP